MKLRDRHRFVPCYRWHTEVRRYKANFSSWLDFYGVRWLAAAFSWARQAAALPDWFSRTV